jgi:hypothetical protein
MENAALNQEAVPRMDLRSAVTLFVSLGAMFLFFSLRNWWVDFFYRHPDEIYLLLVGAFAGAIAFAWVRFETFPRMFSVLTRATAIGIFVYLAVEPPEFTLANPEQANLLTYVDRAYWPALIASFASIWRPSFMFPAACYAISTRHVVEAISGFPLSELDIKYMMEMGQFLSLCCCGLAVLHLVQQRIRAEVAALDIDTVALCLAFIALGFHLGNYFWSGYEKLVLGPQLWSWAWENQTQNMMVTALKKGVLPSGASPYLTQVMFDSFGQVVRVSNIFVVAVQLFAVIAVLRPRWLVLSALAYDAFHIGIYVFGGLFFWPWIWNNGSIILAARYGKVNWLPKACCVITVLLGFSSSLGGSARLAWFDVLDVKISSIQAENLSGDWVEVPVSFFLSHSYAMSHGYYNNVSESGHYAPTIWGSATNYQRQFASGKCEPPQVLSGTETAADREIRLRKISRFIRANHKKMLTGYVFPLGFYLRSHHHPSNPWLYADFNKLDLSTVDRYRVVVQSVCLGLDQGQVTEHELKRDEIIIDAK